MAGARAVDVCALRPVLGGVLRIEGFLPGIAAVGGLRQDSVSLFFRIRTELFKGAGRLGTHLIGDTHSNPGRKRAQIGRFIAVRKFPIFVAKRQQAGRVADGLNVGVKRMIQADIHIGDNVPGGHLRVCKQKAIPAAWVPQNQRISEFRWISARFVPPFARARADCCGRPPHRWRFDRR